MLVFSFPFSTLISQHRELSAAATQLAQVRQVNRQLTEQEKQLSSKAEIERRARQDYQLVEPGQTLYNLLPGPGTVASPADGTGTTAGDPGNQPLVSPSRAPDTAPDPGLPALPATQPRSGTVGRAAAWRPRERPRDCRRRRPAFGHGWATHSSSGSEPWLTEDMAVGHVAAADLTTVTEQLGRSPAGPFEVVVRSDAGTPVVIANAPFLADGAPMPTRFWLTDPSIRGAVSRLESRGGVASAEAAVDAREIADAHARYASGARRADSGRSRGARDPAGVSVGLARGSNACMPMSPGG